MGRTNVVNNMNLSERAKADLFRILTKLESDSFNEDDIEKLLIYLRANFKGQNLIWEFASFIAHPEERDKGVFHQALDVNYAKLKFVHANDGNQKIEPKKIDVATFETLILGSLDKYPERDLILKTSFRKKNCLKLIKKTYKKEGSFYIINDPTNIQVLLKIMNTVISTVYFEHAFKVDALLIQFRHCFKTLVKRLNISFDYKLFLKDHKHKLILCIMCLIHSSKFKLFDGKEGICNLSVSRDTEQLKNGIVKWNLNLNASVVLGNSSNVMWPLMSLSKDIETFIPEISSIPEDTFIFTPPFFNAIRNNDGDLILGKKE